MNNLYKWLLTERDFIANKTALKKTIIIIHHLRIEKKSYNKCIEYVPK